MSFMVGFNCDLIAHELAHQWFGDHITCSSWKDIWIHESFATYCTGLTYENLPQDSSWMSWEKATLQYVMENARNGSVIVDDTTDVNRIFNTALSYNKGSYVLHLLRYQIGDEAFFKSINLLCCNPNIQ